MCHVVHLHCENVLRRKWLIILAKCKIEGLFYIKFLQNRTVSISLLN